MTTEIMMITEIYQKAEISGLRPILLLRNKLVTGSIEEFHGRRVGRIIRTVRRDLVILTKGS